MRTVELCDIGLIGLAVMGQNLVLNMNDRGFKVAVYNRTTLKADDFLSNEAQGTAVVGAHSLEEFVGLLKKPRKVMLMVSWRDGGQRHLKPSAIPRRGRHHRRRW